MAKQGLLGAGNFRGLDFLAGVVSSVVNLRIWLRKC